MHAKSQNQICASLKRMQEKFEEGLGRVEKRVEGFLGRVEEGVERFEGVVKGVLRGRIGGKGERLGSLDEGVWMRGEGVGGGRGHGEMGQVRRPSRIPVEEQLDTETLVDHGGDMGMGLEDVGRDDDMNAGAGTAGYDGCDGCDTRLVVCNL